MGNKVLSIFSLFSVFIFSSCLVQSPQDLITYDDGIYSWNPYPVSNISYINGDYRNFENLSTDYFDAYDEGFFDGSMNSFGAGYSYGNQYIVRGPIRRNWYFNRNSFYPAYFNGFNSPWNHSYNYSFGFNNPWGNQYSYGYGFNNPWGNPYSYGHRFNNFWGDPYSYGYGFNNPWGNRYWGNRYWGNRYNCFSCGNWGWDNSNGDVISDSGSNLDLPDPNSSQRKLDLNGSTPIRRPSISNKLKGGEIQKTTNDKISEKRIKSSGESDLGRQSNSISLKGSAKLYRTGNRKGYNLPTNSKIRNVKGSTIQTKPGRASKIAGSLNTRSSSTRSSNTRSSNTRSSNTRSSNTRSLNTRSSSISSRNSKGGGR